MLAAIQKWPSGRLGSTATAGSSGRDASLEQCPCVRLPAPVRPASIARARASRPPRSRVGSSAAGRPRSPPRRGPWRGPSRWRIQGVRIAARGGLQPFRARRSQADSGGERPLRHWPGARSPRRAGGRIRPCRTSFGSSWRSWVRIRRARGCSTRRSASRSRFSFLTSGYAADVDDVLNNALVHRRLQRDGDRQGHRLLQPLRASPAAVLRQVPRRLHPAGPRCIGLSKIPRLVDDLRPPPAGAGAADEPDRRDASARRSARSASPS